MLLILSRAGSARRRELLGRRIAELAGVDGRADQVVGEGRDAPRRPERIVVAQLHVGAVVGVCGRHVLGSNLAFELADRGVLDVIDGLPRAQAEPEREERFRDGGPS